MLLLLDFLDNPVGETYEDWLYRLYLIKFEDFLSLT